MFFERSHFGRAWIRRSSVALGLLLSWQCAHAAVGTATIAAADDGGRVTLFYPTDMPPADGTRGLTIDAPVATGNGRLVVISHGSGGSARVHENLARALVAAGFVVVVPVHHGDRYLDSGRPGPDSWTIRPREVSAAIDAVARETRFATLALDRVGLYGMSAGGHTALSLAGGRWSPARFAKHCEDHLDDDFAACVGLATRRTGDALDGLRRFVALAIIRWRFADDVDRTDEDPRIAAIVAAVPFAADFDPASLERPRVPLALITAGRDRWLVPRFHGDRVLEACTTCEQLVALPDAGHGALLSPLPAGMTGLEGELLNDPPGFDRAAATRRVDDSVVKFFQRTLTSGIP